MLIKCIHCSLAEINSYETPEKRQYHAGAELQCQQFQTSYSPISGIEIKMSEPPFMAGLCVVNVLNCAHIEDVIASSDL